MKMAEALQMKQWNHLLYADRMKDNRRKQGWQASWPGRNQAERNLARDALFIIQPVPGYKMLQAGLVRCNLTSRATTLQNQVYFFSGPFWSQIKLGFQRLLIPKAQHDQEASAPTWWHVLKYHEHARAHSIVPVSDLLSPSVFFLVDLWISKANITKYSTVPAYSLW